MQVLTKISFIWYRVLIYYFFLGKWGTSGEEFEFISSGMSIGIYCQWKTLRRWVVSSQKGSEQEIKLL